MRFLIKNIDEASITILKNFICKTGLGTIFNVNKFCDNSALNKIAIPS